MYDRLIRTTNKWFQDDRVSVYIRLHVPDQPGRFWDGIRVSRVRWRKGRYEGKAVNSGKWVAFEPGKDVIQVI